MVATVEVAVAVILLCEVGVATEAVMLLFGVGVATLLGDEMVGVMDAVSETAVAAIGVVGRVEPVVCRGGKLAVNVYPLTEGVASMSPRLEQPNLLEFASERTSL